VDASKARITCRGRDLERLRRCPVGRASLGSVGRVEPAIGRPVCAKSCECRRRGALGRKAGELEPEGRGGLDVG